MREHNQAISLSNALSNEIKTLEDLQTEIASSDQLLLFHKFNGEIVAGSITLATMLGYSLEELQQIYIANIKPKSLRISDVCRINKEDNAPVIFEKRNGQRFPANTDTSAFQVLINGEVTNLCCIEITVFSDLQRYNRKEQQLNVEEIENHLSLLSGEIKRPIDNVSNLLSRLISYCDSESLKADLMIMGDQLNQIGQTSNEMVDTFKLSTNSNRLNLGPFNVFEVIHQCLNELSAQETIRVHSVIGTSVPELLFGDPERLNQLLSRFALLLLEGQEAGSSLVFHIQMLNDNEAVATNTDKKNFQVSTTIPSSTAFNETIESLKASIVDGRTDTDLCVHASKIKILCHLLDIDFDSELTEQGYQIRLTMNFPEVHDFHLSDDKEFLKNNLITLVSLHGRNSALSQQLEQWGATVNYIQTAAELEQVQTSDLVIVVADPGYSRSFYSQILVELAIKHSIVINNEADIREYDTSSHNLAEIYNTGNLGNLIATMLDQAIPFPYILSDDQRHQSESSKSYKALVVGEVINNNRIIASTLDQLNYTVDYACNGIDSVMACSKQKYDLILISVEMERMDGAETIVHIRKTCAINSQVQVIALADSFSDNRQIELKQADIQQFISYPLDPEQLKTTIQATIKRPRELPELTTKKTGKDNQACEQTHVYIDQRILSELLEDTGEDIFIDLLSMYATEAEDLSKDLSELISNGELRVCKQVINAAISAAMNYGSLKLEEQLKQFNQLISDYLLDDPNIAIDIFFSNPLKELNSVIEHTVRYIDYYKNHYDNVL